MGMKTFIDIESGGFKPGEVMVMMARQTGKSTFAQMFDQVFPPEKFKKVSHSDVDGEMWYTIRTSDTEVSTWIRSQNKNWYVEITTSYPNFFDVNEKLYLMLELKFK